MVLGLRDYVRKNRFPGVVLGMSGGIDSRPVRGRRGRCARARMGCTAFDCRRGSRAISARTTRPNAPNCSSVSLMTLPIAHSVAALEATLAPLFAEPAARYDRGKPPGARPRRSADGALQQIRLDGSDDRQQIGDVGGLRHALRRHVRRLFRAEGCLQDDGVRAVIAGATGFGPTARWVRDGIVIPRSIIEKPPTAELRPGQTDQDSLPPYDVLDGILQGPDRARTAGARDRRRRLRHRNRAAGPAHALSGRVQAPPGPAGRQDIPPQPQPRPPIPDHQRLSRSLSRGLRKDI